MENAELTVFKDIPPPVYLEPLDIKSAYPGSPEAVANLKKLEAAMFAQGPVMVIEEMTTHHFAEGIYARQWNQAAGVIAVSKTHAKENFLVLLDGECLISTGEETVHLVAPYITRTMPGVKRAVYAITDITMITFHPNPDDERDMAKLEARYIIPEENRP